VAGISHLTTGETRGYRTGAEQPHQPGDRRHRHSGRDLQRGRRDQ
jgi:hypothetical protein